MSEVLVKLEVAQVRRYFGVLTLGILGVGLLYVAAIYPPTEIIGLLVTVLLGAAFVWSAYRLYQATADTIILTRDDITTASGRLICTLDEIDSVDRGFFAFKPSNGFLIRLKQSGKRSWAPGMWWQIGKRIGIGGVTSPRQSKEMVAIISVMLSKR